MKLKSTLLLYIVLMLTGCSEPSPFVSTDITSAEWGKDFNLTDHRGKPARLADFRGKVVVMFFGYIQCPDVCPATLLSLRDAIATLGEDAGKVQVLFVTVDPVRDTPALLAQYVPAFHPDFLGLYADQAGTMALAKEFKVFFAKQPGSTADSYSVDHTASSYVFDQKGKLRLLLRYGETPVNTAADLKRLLAGQ